MKCKHKVMNHDFMFGQIRVLCYEEKQENNKKNIIIDAKLQRNFNLLTHMFLVGSRTNNKEVQISLYSLK